MSKKIKCKFFPDCLDENECFFIHEETSSQDQEENLYCKEGENCKINPVNILKKSTKI